MKAMDMNMRKLDEFCHEGGLEAYRSELKAIFDLIVREGCSISSRTDEHSSQHVYYQEACKIRISLQKKYNHPTEILWTILHELGHHASGRAEIARPNREQKLLRERDAWKYAEEKLSQFPLLRERMDDFILFSNKCINTYEENYPKFI